MAAVPEIPRLAIVQSTYPVPGRPRIRVTRAMPDGTTAEAAVALARKDARDRPALRFRVLDLRNEPELPEPRVLWDSHPPS